MLHGNPAPPHTSTLGPPFSSRATPLPSSSNVHLLPPQPLCLWAGRSASAHQSHLGTLYLASVSKLQGAALRGACDLAGLPQTVIYSPLHQLINAPATNPAAFTRCNSWVARCGRLTWPLLDVGSGRCSGDMAASPQSHTTSPAKLQRVWCISDTPLKHHARVTLS